MNLTRLKWTKNVNHQSDDKFWAYQDINSDLGVFCLHWKNEQKENAFRPKEGELILLRQRAKVTHIVKLLNNTLYSDCTGTEFNVCRLVQAIWMANFWNIPPAQDKVFGYSVHLEGGRVMELETLPTFQENWNNRGGLEKFQKHVLKELNLQGKKQSSLLEIDEDEQDTPTPSSLNG